MTLCDICIHIQFDICCMLNSSFTREIANNAFLMVNLYSCLNYVEYTNVYSLCYSTAYDHVKA